MKEKTLIVTSKKNDDGKFKTSTKRYVILVDSILEKHGEVIIKASQNAIQRAFRIITVECVRKNTETASIKYYRTNIRGHESVVVEIILRLKENIRNHIKEKKFKKKEAIVKS